MEDSTLHDTTCYSQFMCLVTASQDKTHNAVLYQTCDDVPDDFVASCAATASVSSYAPNCWSLREGGGTPVTVAQAECSILVACQRPEVRVSC